MERARSLEGDVDDVYVVANNHNFGKAVTNGQEFLAMFTRRRVPVPSTLLEHYPALHEIATK